MPGIRQHLAMCRLAGLLFGSDRLRRGAQKRLSPGHAENTAKAIRRPPTRHRGPLRDTAWHSVVRLLSWLITTPCAWRLAPSSG